jgi:hypothetical protein
MNTRNGTLAVLIAALACAAPATASPTKVNVRVEGAKKTIFEGAVTTDGHALTKDASGPHPCDGTNGGANPTPGATLTAALDDATKLSGLDWTGSWDDSFKDFLVNSIGPDAASSTNFWGYALNGIPTSVGGCQQQVKAGDEVLFYYGGTFKYILHASGPSKVRAGKLFHVKVIAYETSYDAAGTATTVKKPIGGAKVGSKKTNSKGIATLRFRTAGTKRLKARRASSVRSNQVTVKVLKAK